MSDINEPTLPAIPEAAIEALLRSLASTARGHWLPVSRDDARAALFAAIPHLFAPTSPLRDRGKMIKPMPGAPSSGYPVAAAEPAKAELVERLRNVQRHFSDPGSSHRAIVTEAIAALTAADARVVDLEREAAQWQAAAGQSLVRAEALEDRLETVERERDEAREYGKQARLRENAAEDARIHEHDLRVAAEAEFARLQSAQSAGDRPDSGEAGRTLLNQEQINGD